MPSYVSTDDIKEGMVLAENIKNKQGVIMLSQGVKLNENHKKIFKTWNISGILIDSDEDKEEIPPEFLSYAKRILESVMDWECSSPVELDLFDAAVTKIAKDEYRRAKQG